MDSLHKKFDPEEYEDSYRAAVLDLLKRKGAGKEIDLAEQEEPEHGDDLMAALQASLAGEVLTGPPALERLAQLRARERAGPAPERRA